MEPLSGLNLAVFIWGNIMFLLPLAVCAYLAFKKEKK